MGRRRPPDHGRGSAVVDLASSDTARWIDTDEALTEVIDGLVSVDAFAVDTEFHRERTYYPQLALVQLAWADQLVLVDPLAVDMGLFARALQGDAVVVMHAASQDLEVLDLACGVLPRSLFDTQVAAGFCGHSLPSLVSLVEREYGVYLPKGDRLTDWLRRPLGAEQRRYAASDVEYLLGLHGRLCDDLATRGRLDWALEECELHRQRGHVVRDPEEAWLRIKEARPLRGVAAGTAKAIAAWRERRAAELDQPVRFVMSDLAVVGVAQRAPTTLDDLRRVRGVDDRVARGQIGRELLDAVALGREQPVRRPKGAGGPELDRQLRPAVTLVSAWVSQLARDQEIDTSLLATRADIESFLAGETDGRLRKGWRHDLVGERIEALVGGAAALAFNGHGGLVLERRSNDPL